MTSRRHVLDIQDSDNVDVQETAVQDSDNVDVQETAVQETAAVNPNPCAIITPIGDGAGLGVCTA